MCRNAFIAKLKEPLYALTELTEEENRHSKLDLRRQKNLGDVTKAYRFLLKYSLPELRSIDYCVVKKVHKFAHYGNIFLNFRSKFLFLLILDKIYHEWMSS